MRCEVRGVCHLLAEQYHSHAAGGGAGAVRDARDVQVAHGLLVVDDVGDGGRQREAHLAALPRHEHLEAEPHRVQVDALRLPAVAEPRCTQSQQITTNPRPTSLKLI